jgi:hypothetical protein
MGDGHVWSPFFQYSILTNIHPVQTGKKLDPVFRSLARVVLDIFTRAGWIVGLSVFDIWYHVSLGGVDEAWQRV